MNKIKMFLANMTFAQKSAVIAALVAAMLASFALYVRPTDESDKAEPGKTVALAQKPEYVRGIHITSWSAGSKKVRERFAMLFHETELNSAVIDIKSIKAKSISPAYPRQKTQSLCQRHPDLKDYIGD